MEKHNGYEGPLWSFVDDVCVGEPVGLRKNKTKWGTFSRQVYKSPNPYDKQTKNIKCAQGQANHHKDCLQ